MTQAATLPQGPIRADAGLRAELADFFAFARRPRLGRRLPASGARVPGEWAGVIPVSRVLRWMALLWLVNLMVSVPLALGAAGLAGAQNRLEQIQLAWWQGVLLAPVLEELTFRYFLRRPAIAIWLVPALLIVVFGWRWPAAWIIALLCLSGLRRMRRARTRRPYLWPWRAMRRYVSWFPSLFHLAALVFALSHLNNFNFNGGVRMWAVLPLMALPQWTTGLVLGWMRVRFGIGASMALHGLYNAGPMTLLWLLAARSGA